MAEYARHDQQIQELECELAHRKELLALKLGKLQVTVKTNTLLEDVVEDYKYYNNAIIEEKNKQEEAMQNILEHLNKIVTEENLTDESLKHTKLQQRMILKELSSLKDGLAKILDTTNTV